MTVVELLKELSAKAILLARDGDDLIVRGNNRGNLNSSLVNQLRIHKEELLNLIGESKAYRQSVITPELLPLIELQQAEIDRVVEHVPGGAKNIQDIYPLAPLQEGILFHHLMNERGDAYVTNTLMAFDGREYLDRFLVALQSVIDRHDILRTGVMWEGLSEGVQVVWRQAPLPIEELEGLEGVTIEQLRERFDSRHYRIDVRNAPLVRAIVSREKTETRERDRWLLMLLNHHLVMDHTTLDILIAEVQAHLLGSEQQLPNPLPFRNFVAQARLGVKAAEHETFFKEMLEKVTEPTLPFGLQDVQGDGGQRVESYRALEQELVSRIREQARANKVSVASLCHVAFAQVLARVSSQARVVFGTILFGRMGGSEGADRVLGMFINTLPICIEIDGRNVRESVQQTHRLLAELMRHEHASLALAQRCSGVATGTPLFSALLNYRHNQRVVGEGAAAWEGMEVLHSEERTNYPLTLSVEDDGEGLGFTTQASGVEPERVNELMHTALLQLTEALEHTPGIALQDLDVLPAAEKHRLLVEWNETHQEYPRDKLIHELFEEQAQQTPDAMAVVYEDEQLSYGELNARANQLAHYLRAQGVGPDTLVAICVERSVEMIVELLGILKAGGAYVPLDPSYPVERLVYMLKDMAAPLLLTLSKLEEALPVTDARMIVVDEQWSRIRQYPRSDLDKKEMGLTADHLAYVIYTSGSTGQPKGVSVSHRAVNRLVKNCTYAQLVAETVMAQGANISFDAATFEIWGALLNGAKLIVLNQSLDLEGIAKAIGRHRVGTLWLTSALFNALVETDIDELLGVDQLLVGGEALSPRHIEKGGNRLKETTLINGYGPTECTTFSCTYQIPKGRNNRVTDNVPIGRPIDNTQLYILDGSFELVPIGSSGELYIGGAGLARGYLNRPGLTSERFVPHPFDARGGERLYRTGDACRYLSDGNIEFIGRIDNQVKIRGFRIELGEIESRLNEHPEVEQSVVIAQEDEQSNKRLIAYYTEKQPEGEGAARLTSVELRAYLQSRLPEYMVPAAFVFLQKLPLTLNGKIDRKGLPAPDGESYSRGEYEAPEGGMEEKLAEIWQTLLKVERVGRHDNFFELGGDSIDAMRMIAVLREVMVVEVPVRMLFEAQTLAEQSERIGKVRGEQGVLSKPALMAQARGNRVALSYAQERLWVLEQIGLSGSAYHVAIALRIAGELEEETFGRSVEQLIARHESLRTRFVNEGGQGVQVIDSVNSFRLTQEDLRELPEEARAEALRRRVSEEAAARFDLESGPLLRVKLIKIGDQESVLLMTLHHLITDGWSMGVMVRELSELYRSGVEGRESQLKALPIQYADYALWQREWLQGEALEEQLRYWKEELSGAPEEMSLPKDRARPMVPSYVGGAQGLWIGKEQVERLKKLGQREGATLYMVLLGIFQVLLSRLSGQSDVVIGTPIAGRTHEATEGLIGFFVNMLALRMEVHGRESFQKHLVRVKEKVLGAYGHQDVPFERLVQELKPTRDVSRQPIFQVMFVLQNMPGEELVVGGLKWQGVGQEVKTAKFDLDLELQETADGLVGGLGYARDLFDEESVERIARQYERLVEQIANDSDRAVWSYELLTENERRQILVEWNETHQEYPRDKLIHELFEEQAQQTPDAMAVVYEDEQLSYGELDRRSNQLAHYLREQGVGPEVCVGICMERSVELLIGMLGILKAGGAYVPLDPSYPRERIEYVLSDAGLELLLTEAEVVQRLSFLDEGAVQCVWMDRGEYRRFSERSLDRPSHSSLQSAYVIYTSGSTGRPKGVAVSHRNVTQLVIDQPCVPITHEDRLVYCASPTFDASTWEIWISLLNGAHMVVTPQAVLLDPARFRGYLLNQAASILQLTAGMLASAAGELGAAFSRLDYLLFGGDRADGEVVRRIKERSAPRHLVHTYGPTETVAFAVTHEVMEGDALPIGRPISNTDLYILDRAMQPAPIGVAGELYIGGAGLARGYLNRPGLTSERFVPHPFDARGGERLYRTGDACRYLSDGNIEFIGRIDNQVKIRGFRIELGEIESRLNEHPEVEQSVVIAQEDEQSNKRLIAYYTEKQPEGEGAARLTSVELRAYLQSRLPEYMVPAAFVFLQKLPLTLNGKIDRKGLPAPEGESYSRGEYEAPQGKIEASIAAIWQELLKVERVGRNDNFFELGGHSLLIVQLIERLQRAGMEADVRSVFTSSTLATLAGTLREGNRKVLEVPANRIIEGRAITPDSLPLIELSQAEIDRIVERVSGGAANIQDIYPLAPLQEGILFHHLMNERGDAYLSPLLLAFDRRDLVDRFLVALQSVIDRHDILRTGVMWEGLREPVQVVWRQASLPIEELEGSEGVTLEQLRERFDSRHYRIDVRNAPLARAIVSREQRGGERERWLLLLLNHHLVSDHTTLDILFEEVQAHLSGNEQQLPAPLPFRNFVAQARLGRQAGEDETFFKEMLEKVTEPTLPFGLQDVQGDGGQMLESYRALEQELVSRIREQARANKVSVASLCHVAFAQVLARVSSQARVVFGTILFGRMGGSEGADRVIGMFMNTLPICIEVDRRGVQESVQQTHRLLAELMLHEHASLALAQRCSGVAAGTPLFSALLNYRHQRTAVDSKTQLAWDGIEVFRSEERTNYPLMLSVEDDGNGLGFTTQASGVEPERVNELMYMALLQLTEALESTPRMPLRDLEVLTPAERHRLLIEWNDTQRSYPQDRLIHQLFEEQASRTPDAIAVVYEDEQLSYGGLDRRSNQLAHYLREQGVGPEVRVGICMERSVELLIAIVGILKAGGAYVPIDPNYPKERIEYVIDDANIELLLTQERILQEAKFRAAALKCVYLDSGTSVQTTYSTVAVNAHPYSPLQSAYVIYTSGSTGKPKGATNYHRGLVNRLCWMQAEYRLALGARVLQKTPYSFDVSVWELLWPVVTGGSVIFARPEGHKDPRYLQQVLHQQAVSIVHFVPSMLQAYLQAGGELASHLRAVMCSGEVLSASLQKTFFTRCKGAQLHNLYGPTEASIDVSYWRCDTESEVVPIGRPISNTDLYILDRAMQPAPIGVAGELYIGGAGLARGYLNRPGLTSERFVPHPFDARGGERLYRTGDACRYLSDGNIEFIGRIDNQVKIRGFRIELGEIESRLNEHPEVEQSVVIAQEDEQSNKRLIAYYTEKQPEGEGAARLTSVELRAYLQSRLPEYMVPSAYVYMDALPLTTNGKVDRKGLPPPEGDAYSRAVYQAPEGEREELVAAIWQELLKVERVGRNDNFFELGGHSLLIVQLIERLQRVGIQVEARRVFSSSSLASLAEALNEGGRTALAIPANRIIEECEITPELLPLIALKQAEIDRIVEGVPGGARNIQDIYPLTPLQEGILFHHLMNERGDAYVTSTLMAFDGREYLDRFLVALQSVIDRHDILRTGVMWEGLSEGVQVVWREAPLPIEEVKLAAGDVAAQLRERFDSRRYRLDVRQAPLARGFIAREAQSDRWLLMLLVHHLAIDHTTLEIIVAEVRVHLLGDARRLPEPLPFRNFVAQARLGRQAGEDETFFKEMLEKVTEPTLPFGLQDVQGDGGQRVESYRALEQELVSRIREQARANKVSVASLCHVAFAQVLARVSSQARVVFGTILFGRMGGSEGADRVLGMFINTLPICIEIDGRNVRESVQQTHRLLAELMRHEHASLALAQRCSGVATGTPLFSALLNYRHNQRVVGEGAAAWEGMEVLHSEERTNYPLTLSVEDDGEGLGFTTQASGVEPERVNELMHTALLQLTEALEHTPGIALQDLDVLPAAEKHRLLVEWNETHQEYPRDKLIHELFEEQAQQTPDAMAVVYEDEQLSYGELDRRSNQLAHYLREQGVGPEVCVGICMERSVELLIGMLGILKAGGAYVPLDPSYPRERIEYVLSDAGLELLLTEAEVVQRLSFLDEGAVQCVWMDRGEYRRFSERSLDRPSHSSLQSAYVIYTSGSTGRPKGVAVSHRNVTQLVIDQPCVPITHEDRLVYCASPTFDASTWEIWISLLNGAHMVVTPQAVLLDPARFRGYLLNQAASILQLTAGMLASAAGELGAAFSRLDYLLFGGDRADGEVVRRIKERSAPRHLVHTYGPTETVAFAVTHEVMEGDALPIGRPISNTDLYILDRAMQPAPIGVAGELYIGGAGLARGYLNRPGLTSERFVPHPFDARGGERLYRTGDACRYLSDGNIEFIGRIDNQVKIRGFRIELGEIESRLNEHPEVEQSVVIAQEDEQSNKRLIAYYTEKQPEGEGAARLTSVELRAYLQSRLPEYMVPAAFVFLQKLPLTLNGKIDRKGLPAPEGESYSRGEYEAPQGKIEASIAAIWQELLKVERVGRNDNFFELGGHSLLIVQLIERLQRAGMEADVRSVFTSSTLATLAGTLREGNRKVLEVPANRIIEGRAITPDSLPLIELSQAEIDRIVERVSGGAANIQDIYPLAPLQEGILFHHLMNERGDAYLSPLLLAFDRRDLVDRFLVALQSVIDRHDILRTGVMWEGLREPVQVVWRQASLPIEELEGSEGVTLEQLRERFDSRHYRIDVRNAPLARAIVSREQRGGERERWLLLLLNHHLVSDHTTLDILFEEVQAHLSGNEQQLPAPLPFRNFVAQARLGRQAGEDETFFKEMLEKVTEPTLPFGLQDVQGDGGQRVESYRALEQELVSRIREQARANKVSVASLCHVAFAQVLARVSSQARVVFGTILFGRMGGSEGADRVLGMFINTLPICIEIDGRNVRESVQQTHRLLAELMRHEHASLALAQRCSGVATGTPLFSALLNYRHNQRVVGEGAAAWEGMEVLHSEERTNYPLTLSVEDDGEGLGFTTQASGVEPERVNELMHTALLQLTEALEHTPGIALQDLDVLPAAEKHRLLVEWNETHQEYPRDKLIHELFEEQAQQTPDAMAVVYEDEQLSYGELDRRSNQLAHYLREQGVGPEVCVGICMERSVELLIGMLGILKAGGAYVPLDPSYPKERLDYMLGDSRCLVLLVSRRAQNDWSRTSALRIVVVDSKTDDLHSCGSFSKSLCRAGNLAYLIYTSGSTGRPKGVAITHRNAVAFLSWAMREFDDDQVIRVLASTSICFDLSVFEIFFPLSTGRTIVLAEDVLQLSYMIGRETVDLCNTVPSAMNALIREQQVPRRIRVVNLAGEALHRTLVERIYTETAVEKVFNLYGPSEDTTYSLWTMICRDETRQPPIGIPIDNTRALILDRELRLLPIGVTGELYLAGSGLSRGYWDRPGLTAERFVPDPFGAEEGERLYRTGDACRYLSDGNIEFIGRIDSQVKIRGFRIELGEIENCLNEHAQIQHSVVIAKEDEQNNKRLIAYYAEKKNDAEAAARLTSVELRAYVQSRLPEYMVPSAYVHMKALPLTLSGKIDRKALPAPAPEREFYGGSTFDAPQGEIEESIAAIWQEVLTIEHIGRNDNFFELGGHSLLLPRMLTKIELKFQTRLSLPFLYENPVLSQLALEMDRTKISGVLPADDSENVAADLQDNLNRLNFKLEGLQRSESAFNETAEPVHVLLTGATGFVGNYMLGQLMQIANVKVICLVRGEDDRIALARLHKTSAYYKQDKHLDPSRLRVFAGDLTREHFALQRTDYEELALKVDAIYHCAAEVNHFATYRQLKAANVDGTVRLLEFAATSKLKKFNFLSTLNALTSSGAEPGSVQNEHTDISRMTHAASNGYPASKWAAERMVMKAAENGLPTKIFRLGLIAGDCEYGTISKDLWVYFFIESCLRLGCYFDVPTDIALIPVDVTARAIMYLSERKNTNLDVFHLVGEQEFPLCRLFDAYNCVTTDKQARVSVAQWMEAAEKYKERYGEEPSFLSYLAGRNRGQLGDKENATAPQIIRSELTKTLLREGGIQWPNMNQDLALKYVLSVRSGYEVENQKGRQTRQLESTRSKFLRT